MSIWYVATNGSPTASGASIAAATTIERILGNVAGQSKPSGVDVVEVLDGYYAVGGQAINISGSGGGITIRGYQGSHPTFDRGYGAVNGTQLAQRTDWTILPTNGLGAGIIDYGGGLNSGTGAPYLYYIDGLPSIAGVLVDAYNFGEGTVNSPSPCTSWYSSLGHYQTYNYTGENANLRPHDAGSDGHSDTAPSYGGSSARPRHSWRGQMHQGKALASHPGSRLICRFHTSGSMAGASPAHAAYLTTDTSQMLSANGQSNVTFEGIRFRNSKRHVVLTNCTNFTFRNCDFQRSWRDAIGLEGGSGHKILNSTLWGGTPFDHGDGSGALYATGVTDLLVEGCDIAVGTHHAVQIRSCLRPVFRYCDIHHSPYAFQIQDAWTDDLLIEHCRIYHCGHLDEMLVHTDFPHVGIHLGDARNGIVRFNDFFGNGHDLDRRGGGFSGFQFYRNTSYGAQFDNWHVEDFGAGDSGKTANNKFYDNTTNAYGRRSYWIALWDASANGMHGNEVKYNNVYRSSGGDSVRLVSYEGGTGGVPVTKSHEDDHTMQEAQGGGSNPAPSAFSTKFTNNQGEATNPNMVDPSNTDPLARDYGLNIGSPAIDAGTYSGLTLTKNGYGIEPATAGANPDIGAREGTSGSAGGTGFGGGGGGGGGGGTNQPPTVNLTASATNVPAGTEITFDSGASDAETADASLGFVWAFGDPNQNSAVSGTGKATYGTRAFTYPNPGVYTVSVTVTDAAAASTQKTIQITVTPARGGTKITDFTGWTFSGFGTGGADVDQDGDGTPDSTAAKLVDGLFATLSQMASRSGVATNPQGWTIQAPAAQDPLTRLRVKCYKAALGRAHTLVLETGDATPTYTKLHVASTVTSLVGPGNEWFELDFSAVSGWKYLRITENGNSDGSNYATIEEIEIYVDDSGGGGGGTPPGAQVPLVFARDSDGRDSNSGNLFHPGKAIDGIDPGLFGRGSRWQAKVPITSQPKLVVKTDESADVKYLDVSPTFARNGRVLTYDIHSGTQSDPNSGTWTSLLTDQTNTAGQDTTRHTFAAPVSDPYFRITLKSANWGSLAALSEVRTFQE